MKSFSMLHFFFPLLSSMQIISLSLSAFHSPSVSEQAKSLKKNKIIWLSLMCFDFPISNPVILPHVGMSIISVFHLHKFGLWTTRISISLWVQPYLQIMKSTVAACAVKPGCVFSFVHHKHINSVNPGCSWDYHIFAFYHFWYFIWSCLHRMMHCDQICRFTAAAQLPLKIQFSSFP